MSLHNVLSTCAPCFTPDHTQDRDPRAYQLFLGNVGVGSPSFLASTPERLYVRSGRSEAVAATRPRGAEGEEGKIDGEGGGHEVGRGLRKKRAQRGNHAFTQ